MLEGREYNKAADIYSLSMIVWELWYGTLVCDNIMPAAQVHGSLEAAIRAGARPSLTKAVPPSRDWQEILAMCWSENSRARPSAQQCMDFFTKNKI